MPSVGISRLAPSPSGPLHLGNACTFLVNWALSRKLGWRLLLRVEDLDQPRVQDGAEEEILASLEWLGIDHDGNEVRQSMRGERYAAVLERLARDGWIFESPHSRAEVRTAGGAEALSSPSSAPHLNGSPIRFPEELRPPAGAAWSFGNRRVNQRFRVTEELIEIVDEVCGIVSFTPSCDPGDFIVWTKAGVAAYQLAVVVDDADQGITDVVRGDDLLPSAALQTLIYRALERPAPRWWHLPLVLDGHGRRLSKRDGDHSLRALRERGVDPNRVIGLVAWWLGAAPELAPAAPDLLIDRWTPELLRQWRARPRPCLDASALAWLSAGAHDPE